MRRICRHTTDLPGIPYTIYHIPYLCVPRRTRRSLLHFWARSPDQSRVTRTPKLDQSNSKQTHTGPGQKI